METSVLEDNLRNAEQFKLSGNEAFKAKEYRKAIGCYHRALLYLKSISMSMKKGPFSYLVSQPSTSKAPDEVLVKVAALTSDCYNNLAACLLASENPKNEKVIEYCQMSLAINPDNLKAVFRMGTALANLGQYEQAKEVLTSNKYCGTEKKIVQLLAHVEQKIKEVEHDCKKVFQRMFQPAVARKPGHSTTDQDKEKHCQDDPATIQEVDRQLREEDVTANCSDFKQPGCGTERSGEFLVEKTAGDTANDSFVLSEHPTIQTESVGIRESKQGTSRDYTD